jgi:hypothetical protein
MTTTKGIQVARSGRIFHIFKGLVPKAHISEWSRVFKDILQNIIEYASRFSYQFIEKERI